MAKLEKETEIQWVKPGTEAFVGVMGKDVVVLRCGNFIIFVETSRPDKKEVIYNACSEVKGDGVRSICTHRHLLCFAFSENCHDPRILIMSYPSFEVVKSFETMTSTNYLALRFSEMEFLVALTGLPDFKIIIWNWRTAEKIYAQETQLQEPQQILRISLTSPIQIVQASVKTKNFIIWDMNFCYKKILLKKASVVVPESAQPPFCFAFGADGDVYFVDSIGSLYSINFETRACSLQHGFVGQPSPAYVPCLTWFRGGVAFANPEEVIFLRRKSPEGWAKIWFFSPKIPMKALFASSLKDLLGGVNNKYEIFLLKGETQIDIVPVKNFGADFDFVCFLNNTRDYFVTYGNSSKCISIWNILTGQKTSQILFNKNNVTAVATSPKWPFIVLVNEEGWLSIINVYDPISPLEMEDISLTTNPLDAIRFNKDGDLFCVANTDVGEFFLTKASYTIEVLGTVKINLKIVDFMVLNKDSGEIFLLIVPKSQICCRSGQTLMVYNYDEKEKTFAYFKDVKFPFIVTQVIHSFSAAEELFCVAHRSRKIFLMNATTGKMINEYVTGHQMKIISIRIEADYLFTFGIDGLVIIKLLDTKKCATLFAPHHRLFQGVKALAVDPNVTHVLTLGYDGVLVCTQIRKPGISRRRSDLEALAQSGAFKGFLMQVLGEKGKTRSLGRYSVMDSKTRPTELQLRKKKSTWSVMREFEKKSIAEQMSRKEKLNILDEFLSLKKKLRMLLDENLANAKEKQLPLQAFDLDKAARRKKLEDAKAEREKEKQFQLASMKALNKVTEVIKKICWESVSVKGRQLRGISAPIFVQSYALLPEKKFQAQKTDWVQERIRISQLFSNGDFFEPWVPRTDSELELHINNKFQTSALDVIHTIKTRYEEEQLEEEKGKKESEARISKLVWSGTSTHNFVDVEPNHYSQFELVTFYQSHQEIQIIEIDIKKLMLWFNQEFAKKFESKEREMAFIVERNNRLRHIISELSFFNFSSNICETKITDPEWAPEETPEKILVVEDKEITAPMYISASRMELLQKKEAEAERLRQLMMADDFKERALITMMDGVLEKLWEEEIKKDVPKPKCLVDKSPEHWTEEDLKAVKVYEEAVKFLNSERERYRKLLEAEWSKTVLVVKDSVNRFDEKVAKLQLLKLQVESAVQQEILKCMRIQQRCLQRIEVNRKIEVIKSKILKNEKRIEWMNNELNKLLEMQNECKYFYDILQNKDKNLDKNFKREFPDISPMISEQLYKTSKKRPKLGQKVATQPTVLGDMGRCALSAAKPDYMPSECIQFLKDLDALDAYANAPPTVSQQTWELACKLRRAKIEAELKIKACAVELADAETTVVNYQKTLRAAKDEHLQLQTELQAFREEKLSYSLNYQIQLVLKKGLVEIPLSGQLTDFENCLLVTKNTLNEVNQEIQKMGKQKIKAMRKAANFRKGIVYKEWEHKKLRMEIEDLKAELDTVEKLQVLKELQAILTARARGISEEKGFLYLENELAKVKEKFEKTQAQIFQKLDEIGAKIDNLSVQNQQLDVRIVELNVEMNEMNLSRDLDFDKKNVAEISKRMKKIRERSAIVREIQEQHNEILLLQTELELLRLKTYPTIKHRIS